MPQIQQNGKTNFSEHVKTNLFSQPQLFSFPGAWWSARSWMHACNHCWSLVSCLLILYPLFPPNCLLSPYSLPCKNHSNITGILQVSYFNLPHIPSLVKTLNIISWVSCFNLLPILSLVKTLPICIIGLLLSSLQAPSWHTHAWR